MVSMILLRALHKDISRYNAIGDEGWNLYQAGVYSNVYIDGANDDFGWKMIHADVFRPPALRMLLCVLLGTGSQLFCMVSVTLGIFQLI